MQAQVWHMRGKVETCGCGGRGSPAAEHLLANAVKLDPRLVGAWNSLGECFWERGELWAARGCFEGALEHERNCESMCHLAMLLRAFSTASGGCDGHC